MRSYDAVIIGTGQAGKPLARGLAAAGWKTAIIERLHVGGTCINVGCTPTKTMVASARVAYLARRAADYGVHVGPVSVDLAAVRRRKQAVVESFREGSRRRLESTEGVDLIFGEARFTAPRAVRVALNEGGTLDLQAGTVVVNTGCRPAPPDVAGLEKVGPLDSTGIMELESLPDHLVVLGGGYVGLEFAQMFRRFGSPVTIVHRGRQLLSREDPDVAEEVARILAEDGVDLLLQSRATGAARGRDGRVQVTVRTPETERVLAASHVLVATGRVPNTERLDLPAAGVATDERGFIAVDAALRTSAEGVYALGDVKGGPAFTHISYDDYRLLEANLLRGASATTQGRLVPYTVFIDPQLGRVGLTEQEARSRGLDVRVARLPMSYVARALETDETRGFMKAVVEAATGRILGCAVLGLEGGEVMSIMQVAMMGGLPYTALRDAVFSHPNLSESLNNLFLAMDA